MKHIQVDMRDVNVNIVRRIKRRAAGLDPTAPATSQKPEAFGHGQSRFAVLSLAERHALLLTAAALSGTGDWRSRFFSWTTSWERFLILLKDRLGELDRAEFIKRQQRWS